MQNPKEESKGAGQWEVCGGKWEEAYQLSTTGYLPTTHFFSRYVPSSRYETTSIGKFDAAEAQEPKRRERVSVTLAYRHSVCLPNHPLPWKVGPWRLRAINIIWPDWS